MRLSLVVVSCAYLVLAARGWSLPRLPSEVPKNVVDSGARTYARRSRCPEGSWRHLEAQALRESLLPLSQIVIRHEEVLPGLVPLSVLDWNLSLPVSSRTINEAYTLGDKLVASLIQRSRSFDEAIASSEDPVTRAAGGRLGVFPASEFSLLAGDARLPRAIVPR